MRPLERTILRVASALGLIGIVVAVFMPVFACGCKVASEAVRCLSKTKQQASGHLLYSGDHDERFSSRDYWMDAIAPYVKDHTVFHDREVPEGVYSYAFNAALDNAKEPPEPDQVPLVYDSVNPSRNASDLVTSLPARGRHRKSSYRTNSIGYADGHANFKRYEK